MNDLEQQPGGILLEQFCRSANNAMPEYLLTVHWSDKEGGKKERMHLVLCGNDIVSNIGEQTAKVSSILLPLCKLYITSGKQETTLLKGDIQEYHTVFN